MPDVSDILAQIDRIRHQLDPRSTRFRCPCGYFMHQQSWLLYWELFTGCPKCDQLMPEAEVSFIEAYHAFEWRWSFVGIQSSDSDPPFISTNNLDHPVLQLANDRIHDPEITAEMRKPNSDASNLFANARSVNKKSRIVTLQNGFMFWMYRMTCTQ